MVSRRYSVTPVALDRNPGDLWARDPRKLADATGEASGVSERIVPSCGFRHSAGQFALGEPTRRGATGTTPPCKTVTTIDGCYSGNSVRSLTWEVPRT